MKKLMLLAALLALVVVATSPALAQTIDVGAGNVTITDSTTVEDSIVQNCPASVTFGDENVNEQVVSGSQNAAIVIDGDENEVSVDQSLSQSGFSPTVTTSCTQSVAQAFSF